MQDFNSKQSSNQALACQTQIANSLRLINVGLLRTEQYVDIFMVDILIGNEFVIEVNGSIHYVYNLEGEKSTAEYNIKTLFRSWYLQKLGYKIIDIDLEEYNDGSLEITRQVYEIFSMYSGKKDCTNFYLPQHKHKWSLYLNYYLFVILLSNTYDLNENEAKIIKVCWIEHWWGSGYAAQCHQSWKQS